MSTLRRRVHSVSGTMAILCIACFMTASVVAELYGDATLIIVVKQAIIWGLLVLVPCLAATGISGYRATGGTPRGLALVKFRRMRIIGLNGICVLVPSAFFLAFRATTLRFGWPFYAVQALEFIAGSVNLVLMGMNFRDGLHMSRLRQTRSAVHSPMNTVSKLPEK